MVCKKNYGCVLPYICEGDTHLGYAHTSDLSGSLEV